MEVISRLSVDGLAPRLARILLASLDSEPGRVVVITPWLANVTLPVAGHQSSLLGANLSEVRLDELLGRVARRHEVHLIVKAPHELVGLAEVARLLSKVERRAWLLMEEELEGYALRDELIAEINADIDELVRSALGHYETIEFALRLRELGVRVHFLNMLHAKLLWTPLHALFGSANLTHAGLSRNDELMAEVTDPESHKLLGEAAEGFLARSVPSEEYNLTQALRAANIDVASFRAGTLRIPDADYPRLAAALKGLSTMVQ
jgi:phosphatidylserine/phosphatidylglycerophosphate/cardiolipin synthase-like enzyme